MAQLPSETISKITGGLARELAKLDPQQCRIVELRFFGGLSIEETAQAMNLSPTTVKRHWATAKLWLHHQLSRTHEA